MHELGFNYLSSTYMEKCEPRSIFKPFQNKLSLLLPVLEQRCWIKISVEEHLNRMLRMFGGDEI